MIIIINDNAKVIGVTQISKNGNKLITENNSIKQSAVYHNLVNFGLEIRLIYGGQVLRSTVNIMFVFNYNNKIMNHRKSLNWMISISIFPRKHKVILLINNYIKNNTHLSDNMVVL